MRSGARAILPQSGARAARRFMLALTIVMLLGGEAIGAPVTRASALTDDIPGVPLPGSVVSGQLGGPIYDVVYSVEVPAGNVLVVGLTGPTGADFDLYLYDASATTVASNEGLVAKSVGSTATEHLSHPTQFAARFYIDLFGASDLQGTYTLTVQVVPDPTPAIVSISLADGRTVVSNPTVSVDVEAYDDLSGAAQMSFSQDGVTWAAWQPVAVHTAWTFPAGDGAKTLWVRVRNGVGLVSPAVSSSVRLDTVAPSIVSVSPAAGQQAGGLRPTFEVTFDEPIDPTSWADLGLIVQSADGVLVQGTYTTDSAHRIGRFVPDADLNLNTAYVVTVGIVTDVAGNAVRSTGSWVITVGALAATITLVNSASVITWGQNVTITAQFGTTGANRTFILERTRDLVNWFTDATLTTDALGRASFTYDPATNNYWRARFTGAPDLSAATSNMTRTVVRQIALLRPTNGSSIKSIARNTSITFTTTIRPSRPELVNAVARFAFYRLSGGKWTLVTTRDVTVDSLGKASTTYTFPSSGSWYVRSRANPTPLNANSYWSPIERYNVH